MEGIASQIRQGPQGPALVGCHDSLSGIFYHQQAVLMGDLADALHVACHSGVVHHHDHPRAIGDGSLDLVLVQIHGVRTYVHEHQLGTGEHESGGSGAEGVAGKDDLIPWLQVAQKGRHLKGRGAAGGQKHLLSAEALLQPGAAFLGKGAVSADLAHFLHALTHIFQLGAHVGRLVEGNHGIS